jgi:signal transduction histidine kinase
MYRMGIWRLTASGWEVIAGGRNLPTGGAANLVPSPAGGFWVLGPGNVLRVMEDTALADGWRVEERLTEWHGVPQSSVSEIVEDSDGTLWIATMLGVVRVPASVRRATLSPPRVLLAEGSVDDQRVGFDADLRLPYERNRLRLRFTAVSYRDPRLLRFQVRAQPNDSWETVTGTPEFRWVDLKAGRYRAEVRASLDGVEWSSGPAAFAFRVLPPWYRSIWALLLFGSVIAALVVYVHRARVAVHVELERQRMRIAMDLHDELGSGLGSIGILAGVLRSAPYATDQSPADRVAGEIGSTAASLGAALSDIVWALDRRSGGLDAIAARLAEHGNRLCANGVSFCTTFPEAWPTTRLDLAGRRNTLLIGVEALHNAARHARPSRIDLSITVGPGNWILEIADDGCGMPSDASIRGGVGLGSMRRRAQEIAADIEWLPRSSGGTMVRLSVKTNGRPKGPLALRRLTPRRKATLA